MADKKRTAGVCQMFGGYGVLADENCDSREDGQPGTKNDHAPRSKPPHLHTSEGRSKCSNCSYFHQDRWREKA